MCIIDLLCLAFHPVIFPKPGMERLVIDPTITGRLRHRLI
jgi:hypothetical protein